MATISRAGISQGGTIQPAHITNIIDALDGTSATTTVIATGSFVGTLNGTASYATTATSAQTVNTTTSALNYEFFPTFVDADNGSASPEAVYTDAGIRYNPSTNILTTTASFATSASYALSASYAANVPVTASYALAALSASYAVTTSVATSASFATTASFALNAGGSGTGFPFTGSAQITGSLGITGSLRVSGSATINGTTNLTGSINVDQAATGTLSGKITGAANLLIDLTEVGKSPAAGTFIIPNRQPDTPYPGSIYIDVSGRFYIYDGSNWRQIQYV